MKALVVYESMFGKTEAVARAIASGLQPFLDVQILDTAHAPAELPDEVTVVVAGGPTHAFSMSRPSTWADAQEKGATHPSGAGLREWLESLPSGRHSQKMATFDTRVAKVRHLPGSAAKSAAKSARRHGFEALVPAESFYVEDPPRSLAPGRGGPRISMGHEPGRVDPKHRELTPWTLSVSRRQPTRDVRLCARGEHPGSMARCRRRRPQLRSPTHPDPG